MKEIPRHDSQRGEFAYQLYRQMETNNKIWVVCGDLGFGMLDSIKNDFPDRFINTGAAEQSMMGLSVGLAMSGKIPFVYSISTFLLYRPYETIRNYIDRERIPVRLVGGGRDRDYAHDGFSHWSEDQAPVMKLFKNIQSVYPKGKAEMEPLVDRMVREDRPWYLNLRR